MNVIDALTVFGWVPTLIGFTYRAIAMIKKSPRDHWFADAALLVAGLSWGAVGILTGDRLETILMLGLALWVTVDLLRNRKDRQAT